jgi:hypothetical protein
VNHNFHSESETLLSCICLKLTVDSLIFIPDMTSWSQPLAAADCSIDPRFDARIDELFEDAQPQGADLVSDLRIDELLQNRTPDGTRRNDSWALRKFNTWIKTTTFALQFDDFESIPIDRLNYVLERFLL